MKSYLLPRVRRGRNVKRARLNYGARNVVQRASLGFGVLTLAMLLMLGRSIAQGQAAGPSSQANGSASGNIQPVGTMSDIMVSMVYPAANNILLSVYRGGPQNDKEWLAVQRDAVLLAESGNVLTMRGPTGGQGDWGKDARMLVEAGASAYKAAQAKDANAFMAVAQPLNAACTTCHKQYRANIAGPNQRIGPSRLAGQ